MASFFKQRSLKKVLDRTQMIPEDIHACLFPNKSIESIHIRYSRSIQMPSKSIVSQTEHTSKHDYLQVTPKNECTEDLGKHSMINIQSQ